MSMDNIKHTMVHVKAVTLVIDQREVLLTQKLARQLPFLSASKRLDQRIANSVPNQALCRCPAMYIRPESYSDPNSQVILTEDPIVGLCWEWPVNWAPPEHPEWSDNLSNIPLIVLP